MKRLFLLKPPWSVMCGWQLVGCMFPVLMNASAWVLSFDVQTTVCLPGLGVWWDAPAKVGHVGSETTSATNERGREEEPRDIWECLREQMAHRLSALDEVRSGVRKQRHVG